MPLEKQLRFCRFLKGMSNAMFRHNIIGVIVSKNAFFTISLEITMNLLNGLNGKFAMCSFFQNNFLYFCLIIFDDLCIF